jgi:hypothetical protein
METSSDSTLPLFKVAEFFIDEPKGSYTMLEVTCPRCEATMWVGLRWRVLSAILGASDKPPAYVFGRMCTNCFKTSAIPPEWRVVESTTNRKSRRVVRRRRSKP